MFEIGPILWLQGFESPALTLVMRAISNLGSTLVYITFLLPLSFWLRLKPTLGVLLGVLLAAAATEGLKSAIALPRPDGVCAELQQPGRVSREAAAVLVLRDAHIVLRGALERVVVADHKQL